MVKDNIQQEKNNIQFNKKISPILSMLCFISSTVFNKISTWVILGIFSVIILVISLAPLFITNESKLTFVNVFVVINGIFISLFSGIQGIIKSLNVFKDTQKNGVELIIISKPITRNQILLSRFIFLFLFAICLSLINMLIIIIGCAATGFDYYLNSGAIIGGAFGGTFLSFIVMGLVACAISLKFSNKTSSALPITILSISSIIAFITSFAFPAIAQNPTNTINERIVSDVSSNLVGQEFIDYSSQPKKIRSINFQEQSYTTFFGIFYYDNEIYFDSSPNTWNFYSDIIFEDGSYGFLSSSDLIYNSSNANIKNLIITIVNNVLSTCNAPASGLTSINYLNPMSAFSSICGSQTLSIFDNEQISYNCSISNIESLWSNTLWRPEISKQDPIWALFIMWFGIGVIMGVLIYLGYRRKDFH